MSPPYLFSGPEIFSLLENHRRQLKEEISRLSPTVLEQISEQDLVRELAAKYKLELPVLEEDKTYITHQEIDIDVSRDPMRMVLDRRRPFYIKGVEVTYHVPFKGDRDLFHIRPATFGSAPPIADVTENELLLKYQSLDNNAEAIRSAHQRSLDEIRRHLAWLQESIAGFNSTVGQDIQNAVLQRKQKLASNRDLIKGLGMPVMQEGKVQASSKSPREAASAEKSIRSPKKWDVFISHASEDKEGLARPMAEALRGKGVSVWYDEFSLKIGDSLRASIDYGLANSRYGIVVLSQSFFAKHWPVQELNGLVSLEANGRKVILPIWHKVGVEEVRNFSPILADKVAARSEEGLEKLVTEILDVLEEK